MTGWSMTSDQPAPVLRSTPVYRSLLEMKTLGGVEDRIAIFNKGRLQQVATPQSGNQYVDPA